MDKENRELSVKPISATLVATTVAASVHDKDTASVTIRLVGGFDRTGTRVEVDTTLVAQVPAKIVPA